MTIIHFIDESETKETLNFTANFDINPAIRKCTSCGLLQRFIFYNHSSLQNYGIYNQQALIDLYNPF